MVNWNEIFRNVRNECSFADFADGVISGRQLLREVTSDVRPTVSTMLRNRGTSGVRELARRALSRRAAY